MKCKTCGQEVGMMGAISHMIGMHGSGSGQLKCKACGMPFDSEKELMAHQKKEHM
ncbi:MAG: hypothetical protein KGH65_04305 [Candidatus Micrarchaeota archaeon]|nr:hypothetical protein [Candidatus Micrarchaeota archaeon]